MSAATEIRESVRAIVQNRWDTRDYEQAQKVPALADMPERLAKVSPVGSDMPPDLFAALHKANPRPNPDLDPRHAVNGAVLDAAKDTDEWRKLRDLTVGDPYNSALGCDAFADELEKLYDKLSDVQEQAEQAQTARDSLDAFLGERDPAGGLSAGNQAQLDQLRQAAGESQQNLNNAVAQAAPTLGRVARSAVRKAVDEVGDATADAAGWGLDPGTAAAMDPAERLRLASRLRNPRLRQIAEVFGRLRNLSWGARQSRWNTHPEELHDVTVGDEIERLVPAELVNLVDETLSLDLIRRLSERQASVYKMRGNERVGRGSIILLQDSSASMTYGGADIWAAAMGLALLGVARDDNRAFHAVCFGGPGALWQFDFASPASYTTENMLAYAEFGADQGGTDFQTPLDKAIELLEAEHAATGKIEADVILATDGLCRVDDDWLVRFNESRARLGFRVFGLVISGDPDGDPMPFLCDQGVATIDDFTGDGKAVADIFSSVTKT